MEKISPSGRPFLRWAGSKKQLLPRIKEYWSSEHKRYVEPFCGSASLFFDLHAKSALLSDINEELIEALQSVQLSSDLVYEALQRFPVGEKDYYLLNHALN